MLTATELKVLFHYNPDTGILKRRIRTSNCNHVGDIVGSIGANGRLQTKIKNKMYSIHRIGFMMHYGYLPEYLDHIDGNPLNNRILNLRQCTVEQNQYNAKRRKDNTSGVKGLHWHKRNRKWIARLCINKKFTYLGSFINKQDAVDVLQKKRIEAHGEFVNHG